MNSLLRPFRTAATMRRTVHSATTLRRSNATTATTKAAVDNSDKMLVVGEPYGTIERAFDKDDVLKFVTLIGDSNPIHRDASFATTTRFKKVIIPGMLLSSLFSNMLGSTIAGTIYVSQSLKFIRPVFVDESVKATLTVTAIDRKYVTLRSVITKGPSGDVAVDGDAVVYIPSLRS